MKRKVLEPIAHPDLRTYVVWVPVLSRMSQEGLAGAARTAAARRLADPRVENFLDPDLALAQPYRALLRLSEGEPAWDVYLVFDSAARWAEAPPAPAHWMHQLGEAPRALRLDAAKLARTIEALLAAPVE